MKLKGIALVSFNIKNRDRVYMGGIDKYEGHVVDVMDRNEEGDILALASGGYAGMGDILAEDVLCFIPLTKENGIIVPVELQGFERMQWMSTAVQFGIEKFNVKFVSKCIAEQKVSTELNFL